MGGRYGARVPHTRSLSEISKNKCAMMEGLNEHCG